jgi:hypothetical protein
MKNKSISLYELKNKALGFMTMAAMTVKMKCDEAAGSGDIFDVGSSASSTLVTKVSNLAGKALPAVVAVSLLILLFTKDERKLAKEIRYIAVAIFSCLLLKNLDLIWNTISSVTGYSVM